MSSEFSDKTKDGWTKEKLDKIRDFDKLLDSITGSSAREKMLWREIYENAITDRQLANLCFMNLYPQLKRDIDRHLMGGDKLSKYLERMTRSNDQLIKLAELIQKARNNDDDLVDENAIYEEMLKSADGDKH